jgi:hypothetical protein
MFRSVLALLMMVLAAPACAGSRFSGGSHGGFQGGGSHGGDSHDDGVRDDGLHRGVRRARNLLIVYGNCGFGFDCGAYYPGYEYVGGAGNAVTSSGDYSTRGGYSGGGYVPDPVGAEIPPVIFPTSCWVRRAGYDSSGASVGQVLINLCRPSESVTVTRVSARARPLNTGSGAPQSPQ